MLPKKYHAIIFICVLVMLLLLGLHLLGINSSLSQQKIPTASAVASASAATAASYRHPIVYDKLTGATNNQINDVLGATSDYPIDHYNLQAKQFNQLAPRPLLQEEFFLHRAPPPLGYPPPPPPPPPRPHYAPETQFVAPKQQPQPPPLPPPPPPLQQQQPQPQQAQNRIMPPPPLPPLPPPKQPIAKSSQLVASQQQPAMFTTELPVCVQSRQQEQLPVRHLEAANSSSQLPILFCNEDPDYPTKDIMRALEMYAAERSIEQLLPQPLVQIHLSGQRAADNKNLQLANFQQQLSLDTLQPSISVMKPDNNQLMFDEQHQLFPSANYEPVCRSSVFMAQPRRAKNLLNQWKIVVNLPGHKYRGIAISQMLRVEECSRPNGECNSQLVANATPQSINRLQPGSKSSRCLQHYENQRLLAWSHQQGLHLDIFRLPVACSCHIRR